MGKIQTLKGVFTNHVSDAVAHAYKLCGLSQDSALGLFRKRIDEFQSDQMRENGRIDDQAMREQLYKPTVLLPEHFPLPNCANLVATISIPPEIVKALSLMHKQNVEVRVDPDRYSPEKGLVAIAARTETHPQWVQLNR